MTHCRREIQLDRADQGVEHRDESPLVPIPPSEPCAFLFDNSADGVPEPQLAWFTGQVLDALGAEDPAGRTRCQLRVGLPMLPAAAERTTAVSARPKGGGRTVSHDVDTYKYLIWDWLDSLGADWSSIDPEAGAGIFRLHTGECITLTALDDDVRLNVDRRLKKTPGYVGAFVIDQGNPVHREAFLKGLIYKGALLDGTIVQELSIEGDPDWPVEGGDRFKPNGLVWKPFGWLIEHGPRLPAPQISERGEIAARRLARKHAGRVEHRLLDAISQLPGLGREGNEFAFDIVGAPGDILEGLMPEGKFTRYLFNPDSADGAPKGAFLVKEMDLDPEDWRFLAAQLYEGLLTVPAEDLEHRAWDGGYGIRFNLHLAIQGRTGRSVAVRSGWMLRPGTLPSLSTVFPADKGRNYPRMASPPILPPGPRTATDWERLFDWANAAGQAAAGVAVPTPMFIQGGEIIAEGAFGSASVRVPDARRGFARWLIEAGGGDRHYKSGAMISNPDRQISLDRNRAWAMAFARVLKMNGLVAEVEVFWS